jgi:hypothetical protein
MQGSARVIRCLQNQRDKLSVVCRATLFNEEARFSENIDFQYPMKQACLREIDRYCKDVPHGQARVIRCLQVRACLDTHSTQRLCIYARVLSVWHILDGGGCCKRRPG